MKRVVFAIFVASILIFPVHAFAAPPDKCLARIAEAMEKGDAQAFEELVDIDGIMDGALDVFMAEARKPENKSSLPPMIAMLFSQSAGQSGQTIKALLLQAAKEFVLSGVGSGAFGGGKGAAAQGQGFFAPLFANASMGRKEIRPLGEAVGQDGGWHMPFNVHDCGNGQDYAVIGRFEPLGKDGAKLVEIENLDQIFEQIQKEAGQ